MIDFVQIENSIMEYVITNFPAYAGEGFQYTNHFLDFDKFKKDNTMFFQLQSYQFNSLSNESNSASISLKVYIVVRNNTPEILKSQQLGYTSAFYKMFVEHGENFDGIVDFGSIHYINFYDYIEGTPNLKIAEIEITLKTEI